MARGSMIAVHSTVSPETCQSLAKVAAEHGVKLIDTPVSGGAKLAEAGQMVVMIGGDKASFEICRDNFKAFATTIVHLGDVGARPEERRVGKERVSTFKSRWTS